MSKPTNPIDEQEHVSQSRRRLLLGRDSASAGNSAVVKKAAIYPPWSVALESNCSKCGDCVAACPEQILLLNLESGLPEVDFSRGECTFCQQCVESCDEDVFDISSEAVDKPWDLTVVIGESCLLTKRIFCRSCGDACPERAIRFALQMHNKTDIVIDPELCTGCGACVSPCPADAVQVIGAAKNASG